MKECDYFQVARSKIFRREGADVHSDVTISLTQAILGGTIRIPGIYGDILLSVSHLVIRLEQFWDLRNEDVCLSLLPFNFFFFFLLVCCLPCLNINQLYIFFPVCSPFFVVVAESVV